jgi:hypothetical protein
MSGTPLQIDDFSGGLTDFPMGANPSELMKTKNAVITVDKKPSVRPGSLKESTTDTAAKLPGSVDAIVPSLNGLGMPYKLSNYNSAGRFYFQNGTTHVELAGPSGNPLFTSAHYAASDRRFITASWNDHLYLTSASFTQKPQKAYIDSGGVLRLRTAGLPAPASTWTASGSAGANSYVYAIGYKYTYTAGNRTFIDRGPLSRKSFLIGSPTSINVTSIPVLSNGASDNYDTATLVVEIYRTTSGGKILYKLAEITNGTTSFPDVTSDANLINNETHYSTSGQPDFDPPPVAKFVHVTERGIGLYGYIQDGSDEMKNRGVQSIPGAPDKVPGSFNFDIDEEMTGISSYKGIPIIFSKKRAYRGEGFFTASGSGSLVPRKIADSVGCISHTSIVQTPDGVFFAGENGFYWTDGFTVTPVSEKIRLTYSQVYAGSAGLAISGTYDETEKRVFWTFQETATSDGIFVLHTRFALQKGGCFTTWGGETASSLSEPNLFPSALPATVNQNFRAKCLAVHAGRIYRGDDRGYAFYFDPSAKTDPRVVPGVDLGSWGTVAISYDVRLVALNFGTNLVRKWTPKAIVTLKNRGNLSLKMSSDRDMENRPKACREFRKRSEYAWGDATATWGDPTIYASGTALIEEVRMLPVPGLRCSYRSLWFQNSFSVVAKSDTLGLATVDSVAKTLTLSVNWPLDLLDLYLAIPDNLGEYTNKLLITAQSGAQITVSDPLNLLSSGTTPWQIMGTAKGHVTEIQSIVLPYNLLDSTQSVYRPGTEGGNV